MTALSALSEQLKSNDFTSIPVIDMADATSSDFEKRKACAYAIRDACLNAGFFYVKNHGVASPVVEKTFEQSKAFFAQPAEVKKSIDISKSTQFRGYMGLLTENNNKENKAEYHEAFNLGLDPSLAPESMKRESGKMSHGENQWPSEEVWEGAEEFKETTLKYYSEILALGQHLFPLFAIALDLPENFFDDKTRHPAAIMRLLFYPGREVADELEPGIGAHTDFECFTILRQDEVPALQVANRKGEWLDAEFIPDTFVINIGDQLARWTNDIFVSTRHRVLPAKKNRYSIPFFFGCDHDVMMDPIPTCISEDRPNKYEVMSAGDYVHMRLSDVYAKGVARKD